MVVRVGINGFGRIGRVLLDRKPAVGIDVVAVNEPNADAETLAFLLEHDSVAGQLGIPVETTDRGLRLCGQEIAVIGHLEPAEIPRADHDVEIVVEASGHFGTGAAGAAHLGAGARRVVVSTPGRDVDLTVCMGVNMAGSPSDQRRSRCSGSALPTRSRARPRGAGSATYGTAA